MKISAGILIYRFKPDLQVFLGHPGGPFFKNKDNGAWSIPKGHVEDNEDIVEAAIREFKEETGIPVEGKNVIYLDNVKAGHKRIYIWAFEKDYDGKIKSNMVNDSKFGTFPELDKAQYFDIEIAKKKINSKQLPFLERLENKLNAK